MEGTAVQVPLLQLFGAGVAVLAGYLFIHLSPYRRFTISHMRADRFAFHVLGYAVCFYCAGVVFGGFLHWLFPTFSGFAVASARLLHYGIPPAVAYSALLALAASAADRERVLHLFSKDPTVQAAAGKNWRERTRLAAVANYVQECNDPAIRLVYRATVLGKQVMLTLKSGKVYVGTLVPQLKDPTIMAATARLIPTISGYRDSETFKVHFTTPYEDLDIKADPDPKWWLDANPLDPLRSDPALLRTSDGIERRIDLEDMGIVLQWSEIISLTIFDPQLYRAFQDTEGNSVGSSSNSNAHD